VRERLLPIGLGRHGPCKRLGCGSAEGIRSCSFKALRVRLWCDGPIGKRLFWCRLLGLDQALAKPPRRRFGTIAATPNRLVWAFSLAWSLRVSVTLARPLRVSIALALGLPSPVAGPLLEPWRRELDFAGRLDRFRLGCAPARLTAAAALPVALAAWVALAIALFSPRARFHRSSAGLTVLDVLRLHVRDVQKTIAAYRKINECGLYRRLDVDDFALVNVAGVALVAGPFHIEFLENAVLDDGDPAFFRLKHIDEHFFLHAGSFRDLRR
jgi:hypothetical protein